MLIALLVCLDLFLLGVIVGALIGALNELDRR